MLQQCLVRSIRRLKIASPDTCAVCRCSCGQLLHRESPVIQRRSAGGRRAPAVREKQRSSKEALTPEEAKWRQQIKHGHIDSVMNALRNALLHQDQAGYLDTSVQNIEDFLNDFKALGSNNRVTKNVTPAVNTQKFVELVNRYGLSERDLTQISVRVLLLQESEGIKHIGKQLLFSASAAGSEIATIRIMNHALLKDKDHPNTLKSLELIDVRKHLREISKQGKNYRAMVLEGKVAYAMGDHDVAISLWRQAMEAAVAGSNEETRRRAAGSSPTDAYMAGADLTDLSSPWVELQSVYLSRADYANAKWAISIGCEQDDPSSHYAAAIFEQEVNEEGLGVATSVWLYHMTKSAASGYVKAMHELGLWYIQNGWPFLEDEPPDHIKPTPFDRYPSDPNAGESAATSPWQKVRTALGLDRATHHDPEDEVFLTAAHPTTPQERYEMALQWLDIAMGHTYAPSFLLAARIHLEKTLDTSAAKRKAAVELQDERYVYASKGEYEAAPLHERSLKEEQRAEENETIPNPHYNPEKAKQLLREVLYAGIAMDFRIYNVNGRARRIRKGLEAPGSDEMALEDSLPTEVGPNVRKWFRYPEIRELYMDDRKGTMNDSALKDLDILQDAKGICDEHGWDIYADDGGLLHRHRPK